jgi:phosphatidate cytidylyltransferase
MLLFVAEAATFREPGEAIRRLSLGYWVVGYLGFMTSFFVQLRWLSHGVAALAVAIFVPKCGDIGAYFTGRAIGRHPMAPTLSPKKTWEGAAGGLAASVVTALLIKAITPDFLSWVSAAGFGVVVGAVAMVGDLMESLIKRDSGMKDASQVVPGFGGVLDVVDSILFSAPVSYWWLLYG